MMVLSSLSYAGNYLKDTPLYSVSVDDIDLSKISVNYDQTKKGVYFEKKSKKEFALTVGTNYKDYFDNANDHNKKVIAKLASLGIMGNPLSFKTTTAVYSLLYKKDRSFNLEAWVVIPMKFKESMSIVRDYASYESWVLKEINNRRYGEKGKYFVDIMSLSYVPDKKWFDTKVKMNLLFKGNYKMDLLVLDDLDDVKDPKFTLKMKEPSKLAKDVKGTFYFIVPSGDEPYYIVYFTGKTEVNWALYNFLPLALVQSEVVERVYTLLENIQYKVERTKSSNSCKK